MPMKFAYVIHVPTREQPIRLWDSHMTRVYIYMGRPLERLGLLNQCSLNIYTCKYMRIINKVGVIIYEDLCLIYEGDYFD